MRVLVVAYYFPPLSATGGMRPLNFCRYLNHYGWQPHVLSVDHSTTRHLLALDEKLLGGLPDNVRIDRIPDLRPTETLLRIKHRLQHVLRSLRFPNGDHNCQQSPQGGDGRATETGRANLVSRIRQYILDSLFTFPDEQRFWGRGVGDWLAALSESERPDIVYATAPPWTSLFLGMTIAEKLKVPFVADFRDPWTDIVSEALFASPRLVRRAQCLEREICMKAVRVVTTTPELRDCLMMKYPEVRDRCIAITNGFCGKQRIELSRPPSNGGVMDKGEDPGAVELCHFGTLYSNRNPGHLFRAVTDLIRENGLTADQLKLHFVGGWDVEEPEVVRMAAELERNGIVLRKPRVSHDECMQAMVSAKGLLVLQPDYPFSIPAKLYEYISVGKPVVVIGGEGATAALVNRFNLGLCCRNRREDISALLRDLVARRIVLNGPDQSNVEQFNYKHLTRRLADMFNEICQEKRATATERKCQ